MLQQVLVRPNAYYDSVTLMAVAGQVGARAGVVQCVLVMGTPANRELLNHVGLLTPAATAARATDLIVAVSAADEATLAAAVAQAEELLQCRPAGAGADGAGAAPRTVAAARRNRPEANLALISVPGAYAAREARMALEHGMHVLLYSNHVDLADELALKQLARRRGLLLMGPDCGTAIIGGVGLGFANRVRSGPIGIVAASGTGAQELSTLIDRLGSGISQLIGTGGRDLSAAIGGLATLDAIDRLQADPQTQVIVVISKPPAFTVAEQVVARLQAGAKPYVLCLLGTVGAPAIDEAAVQAVALATDTAPADLRGRLAGDRPLPPPLVAPGRRYLRGLFSGGTLCDQARQVLIEACGGVLPPGHALVDLGAGEFTLGRPHPMIDPSLRCRRLAAAARDPEVAAVLLDVVLGHGCHPDPAGALAAGIRSVTAAGIPVLAAVTGTEADPQRRSDQELKLRQAGATVSATAHRAARLAAATVQGR